MFLLIKLVGIEIFHVTKYSCNPIQIEGANLLKCDFTHTFAALLIFIMKKGV